LRRTFYSPAKQWGMDRFAPPGSDSATLNLQPR
jgi:hypothetical protein